MLKDITLGQYFPGTSVIHRLDPRTKLLGVILYIVALFLAKSWISYGVVLCFLIFAISVSKIPPKSIVSGMKPLVIILVFTGVLNLFYSDGGVVLVKLWKLTITTEGLERAILMTSRILMLISGIVAIAARGSKGGAIFCAVAYGLAGLLGVSAQGIFADLVIWGSLCLIFAVIFLVSAIKMKKNPKDSGKS